MAGSCEYGNELSEVLSASIIRAVMNAVSISGTSDNFYKATRRSFHEDRYLQCVCNENSTCFPEAAGSLAPSHKFSLSSDNYYGTKDFFCTQNVRLVVYKIPLSSCSLNAQYRYNKVHTDL